jgi:S1-C subfamily serine protease
MEQVYMMDKKAYRTTMPFDGGLSPATPKSRPSHLFGDTPLITDILNRDVSKIMDINSRGEWAPGEDDWKSYKEQGDEFMMDERILEVLKDMSKRPSESWIAETYNGKDMEFPSYDVAVRELQKNGVPWKNIKKRVAQSSVIPVALSACGTVISKADNGGAVGSCFHIGGGRWITCAHCVRKYDRVRDRDVGRWHLSSVTINQGNGKHNATVETVDLVQDIAVLRSYKGDGHLALGSSDVVNIGTRVIAVGSPKGYENNVSEGIVGGKDRVVFFFEGAPEYIFTDAQVLPGNSGGPLIALDTGKVIGMMSLIIPAEGLYGLNAALPAENIARLIE